MRNFIIISCLCVATVLADLCDETLPNARCRQSCDGFGVETNRFGHIGCLTNFFYKCCIPNSAPTPQSNPAPPANQQSARATEQCGVSNSSSIMARLFGGTDNTACDWPWQVSIRGSPTANSLYSAYVPLCSGVLIDKQWVVTTAYCALTASMVVGGAKRHENIVVVAGEHNVRQIDLDATNLNINEEYFRVTQLNIHPSYFRADATQFTAADLTDAQAGANNIALLKLNKDATMTKCVSKVCLPEPETAADCSFKKTCWIAGWGLPSDGSSLQEAKVEIVKKEVWEYMNSISDSPTTMVPLNTIGRFAEAGKNTCVGDNGGMVVCKNAAGNWALEGLINRPGFAPCQASADQRVPLTDVRAAKAWIDSVLTA